MSTDDLAQACGIGRRTLYRIENGEPGIALGTLPIRTPTTMEKILEAASRPQRVRAPASDK